METLETFDVVRKVEEMNGEELRVAHSVWGHQLVVGFHLPVEIQLPIGLFNIIKKTFVYLAYTKKSNFLRD